MDAEARARLERNCRDGWPAPLVDDVLALLAAYDVAVAELERQWQAAHDKRCGHNSVGVCVYPRPTTLLGVDDGR